MQCRGCQVAVQRTPEVGQWGISRPVDAHIAGDGLGDVPGVPFQMC